MNRTNLTKYLRERNWERKYGTVACIISSIILVSIIALLWL